MHRKNYASLERLRVKENLDNGSALRTPAFLNTDPAEFYMCVCRGENSTLNIKALHHFSRQNMLTKAHRHESLQALFTN